MTYRVNELDGDGRPITGIDLPSGRALPGDTIDEAPAWLVEQGYVAEAPKKARTRKGS